MNVRQFNIPEMFSNSKGKTSLSMVCAFILVLVGSWMAVAGGAAKYDQAMSNGLLFATLGTGLLGVRRFTPDKEVSPEVDKTSEKTA